MPPSSNGDVVRLASPGPRLRSLAEFGGYLAPKFASASMKNGASARRVVYLPEVRSVECLRYPSEGRRLPNVHFQVSTLIKFFSL